MSKFNSTRCKKCLLPERYPGLTLNDQGTCNCCKNKTSRKYKGIDKLKKEISLTLSKYPSRKYDGVVGLSGGRDSTYMLHILKKKLNLNVLVFFVDHGLIPDHTRKNVRKITNALDIDLIIEKHSDLTRAFPLHFKAWLKKPRVQTLPTLCMGCK